MKPLTVKDVLYALQYGGQRLDVQPGGRGGIEFRLLPSGTKVPKPIAEQARSIQAREAGNG